MPTIRKKTTVPVIYPKNPKPAHMDKKYVWRVWFRFFDEATGRQNMVSRKTNLNAIPDYRERLANAKALVQILKNRLDKGWNPITNTYPEVKDASAHLKELTFPQALDFAFEKKAKDWSYKTKQDYGSQIKYLKKAALSLDMADRKIIEFERPDYKLLLEELAELRGFDANGYNKYRTTLSSLLSEMIQWNVVKFNFIRDIKEKKVAKSFAHRPPTQDQRLLIITRIKSQCPDYYRFLAVLYGCGIRPKEITRLRIRHLHKLEGVFRLSKDITKNREEREVAIPHWVMDLLSELDLHKQGPETFIFGGGKKMFLPGPAQMGPNTATRYWHQLVKRPVAKGGLGLDITQYSLKKLSADDMVRLQRREGTGNLLELAKEQFGHASTSQTEVYSSEHKVIMQEVIKQKMPQL